VLRETLLQGPVRQIDQDTYAGGFVSRNGASESLGWGADLDGGERFLKALLCDAVQGFDLVDEVVLLGFDQGN
jgi:hypothetical protein